MKICFYIANKGDVWDKLIGWLTKKEGPGIPWPSVSHVELQFDPYNWCWSASPRDGGVRFKQIGTTTDHWIRIDIDRFLTDTDKAVLLRWCIEQEGKKYDWALLTKWLPWKLNYKNDNNDLICSEGVKEALEQIRFLDGETKISPNALLKEVLERIDTKMEIK